MDSHFRIGFVSGKLGGVDGVSLEVDKWIEILKSMGQEITTIAGKYMQPLKSIPQENQLLLDSIRFDTPDQKSYEQLVFPYLASQPVPLTEERRRSLMDEISLKGGDVANRLFNLIQKNHLDVIIAENTNAMPMTLLGAIGVYKVVSEKRMAAVFHHHDFWWERSRFSRNYIESLLTSIMPPSEPGLEHVVISSYSAHILSSFKRIPSAVIPNCEDFDHPVKVDGYNSHFREDFGFKDEDILVIQPTRIVRRKRIEDSLELLRRLTRRFPELKERIHLIVSLYQGDEPDDNYMDEIMHTAERDGTPLHLISDRVASLRDMTADGRRIYTNRDVLVNGDLVLYLPVWEGFGNALIEAIAARVPVVATTYLVYKTDIRVTGIENIEIRDVYDKQGRLVIEEKTLEEIRFILTHRKERESLIEKNFLIGKKEFGFHTLREKIGVLLSEYGDEIRASRKRLAKANARYSV